MAKNDHSSTNKVTYASTIISETREIKHFYVLFYSIMILVFSLRIYDVSMGLGLEFGIGMLHNASEIEF